jgi:hypothetical protein
MYQDSAVVGDDDITVSKEYRSSRSAYLDIPANPPQTDEELILSCIEQRAARFQGHIPRENMENLQVVRYTLPSCLGLTSDMSTVKNSEPISTG